MNRLSRFLPVLVAALAAPGSPDWALARARGDDKDLAAQAKAALAKNCYRCHGETQQGNKKLDVASYKALTTPGKRRTYVVPRSLDKSYVWEKIDEGTMPQDGTMDEADKAAVKRWIEAGAPEFPAAVAQERPYVGLKVALGAIRDCLRDAEDEDRPYLRFFTLWHLHNNKRVDDATLGLYRAALAKALNGMHWKRPMARLLPLKNTHATVFVIDLRDLDWEARRGEPYDRWDVMLALYPYGLGHDGTDDDDLDKIEKDIKKYFPDTLAHIRADWFVVGATRPPLYEKVLRLPRTDRELEHRLGVDVVNNFKRNRLWRAGFIKSGVSAQNRMVERHDALYGAYWKSYDFKKDTEQANLLDLPLGPDFSFAYPGRRNPYARAAFRHDGGEMIFHLPDGLQGYFLTDGKGNYIPKGPTEVVRDKSETSGNVEIVNGLSCMACHAKGMVDSVDDQVRDGSRVRGELARKVKRLYPPRDVMLNYVKEDSDLFLAALDRAVRPYLSGPYKDRAIADVPEPIGELARKYYNPALTLETAAYELGYESPAALAAVIKGNDKLRRLRTLLSKGGTISRAAWEEVRAGWSQYQETAKYLGLGNPRNIGTARD
jgi:serine/threonine-protein kinase